MTAGQLVLFLNWAIYLLLFARVLRQAIRRPWRVNVDIALLFSAPAAFALIDIAGRIGVLPHISQLRSLSTAMLPLIAFLLLRLVDTFTAGSPWPRRVAGAVTLALSLLLVLPIARPPGLFVLVAALVVLLLVWGAMKFLSAARLASGVTRRRFQVVATGSLLFVGAFAVSSLLFVVPQQRELIILSANACGLAAGLCYFIGFAPPRLLRQSWQEPELRAFLSRAAQLPRLDDTRAIVAELERGAAQSLGAPVAFVGTWEPEQQVLCFWQLSEPLRLRPQAAGALGRAWLQQNAVFSVHPAGSDAGAAALGWPQTIAILAAPISAGQLRLGVLAVYAPRAPIFADDDLALIQLLADQAAVILESRSLIDAAARMHAREQATRLKDEFLSATAHDLKTPLTTLVARAQLLERRTQRDPQAAADIKSIQTVVREGQRLRRLVLELLDAARAERGLLVGARTRVDLVGLAHEVAARHSSPRHPVEVVALEPLIGSYDAVRIEQLLENLVSNAIKYSPAGGVVRVTLGVETGEARLAVSDQGIGIAHADLPLIFERFYRGANADERRLDGLGLGLYICRKVVEQHGGRIWATSLPGQGTTFEVRLPLSIMIENAVGMRSLK